MKAAVSLPDDLHDRAERAARRLHRSRSALYAVALAEYLDRHHVDDNAVREALEAVYGTRRTTDDTAPRPVVA